MFQMQYDSMMYVFVSLLFLVLLAAHYFLHPPHRKLPFLNGRYIMPPGPRGSPFFGNLLGWLKARNGGGMVPWVSQIQHSRFLITQVRLLLTQAGTFLEQLASQARFGEMTTLSMGTKTWVLLNSQRAVNEIIARRAAVTHERPYFPIAGGLVSHQNKRLFLQRTEQWKPGRQLLRQLMTGPASKTHDGIIENASTGLLRALIKQPWAWHTYHYPVAIMHKILTSSHLQKSSDELAELQNVTSTFLTSINSSLVEFYPNLERLPKLLQFWRPHWESMGIYHYDVFKHWWKGWEALALPSASPSFLRDAIMNRYEHSEEQSMYVAMVSMAAGSDNPRMALNALLMACLCYPEAASKGRSEVDDLCGADRLASLSDLAELPYVCAMVKEVLRWRPTVPLVPQRVLVEDMEFEGYRFPKGTEFLVNNIAVCNSEFEQPGRFFPERWLNDKKSPPTVAQEPWQFAFSAGKRSCVGYRLAQKEMFLALARILQCFNITARGPIDNTNLNAFSLGEPFPVQFTIRGSEYRDLALAAELDNTWGKEFDE